MGLNLFAQPEEYNAGIFSTPDEAVACSQAIGHLGGGAVQIFVEPLMEEQPGPAKNFHIRLANGRTFNVRTMLTRLENAKRMGSKIDDVVGEYNAAAPGNPAGVSFETTEREMHGLRNWLANTGHPELVVQGSGVISQGATDVDAALDGLTAADATLPPIGNVPANYVVFLANPKGRATIVNAAYLIDVTKRPGDAVAAALAFVRTRQGVQ